MEMAQRREVHEQLLAEVELSARGNREHQLLLLLWQRVLASPFMGKQWLLHRFEWYVREGWTHLGVGDAVFVDEAGRCALVLELKLMHEDTGHTAQVARTKARSEVKDQAEKYAAIFAQQNPDMEVLAATCCENLGDVLYGRNGRTVPEIRCWPLEASPVPRTPVATTATPELGVLQGGGQEVMGFGTNALLGAGAALVATASMAWLLNQPSRRRQQ